MSDAVVKGLKITPDGEVDDVELPAANTTKGLHRAIGCQRVDVVRLTTRVDMWIDEEGLDTAPANQPATAVAQAFGWVWQSYHGTVVITEFDDEGKTTSLSAGARARVLEILGG
ncbi:DUF3846 domain-containing protein (plasmid) [Pseudonocardia sp. DSM 110487]|uniref:DUF3846 domain-containing protein n=1 Tax=Pseudonocardia sp. DSM 110487 TaxID=2865833 RepID=UPI001C6A4079|nr:DUF3846 domain-containing protein [Pseudonocardia sp. DSM 110487]QYN41021.1 DUF3846 domain-containing protein [Pseudonocardia sp. DSM 110487]